VVALITTGSPPACVAGAATSSIMNKLNATRIRIIRLPEVFFSYQSAFSFGVDIAASKVGTQRRSLQK
jgi:hypothetical protein